MKIHSLNLTNKVNTVTKPNINKNQFTRVDASANDIQKYLEALSLYNISFMGTARSFYAIDKDGNCTKFTTRKEAEAQLSIAKSNLAECLQGKRLVSQGYAFVYSDEIETTDEFGNRVIDHNLLEKKLEQLKPAFIQQNKSIPIYAISENGSYKRFPSKYQAAKELGIASSRIIKCLNGTLNKTGGYTFVTPEMIEKESFNDGVFVDENKIKKIVYNVFEASNSIPVYAIDRDGFARKFSGVRKAARDLNLEITNISSCLNGARKRVGGYTFVRASDIEILDENNRVQIDQKKLKDINSASLEHSGYVPVYAIDPDGRYKKYLNKKRAAAAIGVDNAALNQCLKGRYNVINHYAIVLAKDIERVDNNGKISLDFDLIKEKYEMANKNSVYAIDKEGNYKKYYTQTEAANDLGLQRARISACISGERNSVGGYFFIKASDIETFEDGKVLVNKPLLKKFAYELQTSGIRAIYSFDSKGNYYRHGSVKEVAKDLEIGESGIRACLSGKKDKSCGYTFVYADNFEKIDDEGELIIDYEKLDATSLQINPSLKRYFAKYGKIYALKDVNVREYPNIRCAARELGIDEKSIVYFLRTGRNLNDGKKTINGFVLTCEKEK